MTHLPNSDTAHSELISISQAASLLGVSLDTIRRWDKAGKLHGIRADGKNRFFARAEIESLRNDRPLTISEAARELGVSSSTLRRYEKKGLVTPQRSSTAHRVYTAGIVEAFKKYAHPVVKQPSTVPFAPPEPLYTQTDGQQELHPRRQEMPVGRRMIVVPLVIAIVIFLAGSVASYSHERDVSVLGANTVQSGIVGWVMGLVDRMRAGVRVGERRVDVNDLFRKDEAGNIVPKATLLLPSEAFLRIQEATREGSLNAASVQGKVPGKRAGDLAVFAAGGAIESLRVSSIHILAGAISGGIGGAIVDASLVAADIANNAITSIAIGTGEVKESDIADNAIVSSKIGAGEVKEGDVADGAITSAKINDNTITTADLAEALTFGGNDLLDLSAVTHDSTAKRGLLLPNAASDAPSSPTSGEGYLAWDMAGDQLIVYDGSTWAAVGSGGGSSGDITAVTAGSGLTGGGTSGDVTVTVGAGSGITVNTDDVAINLTASGNTGSTSSNSGLEVSSSGLTLLKGCSDNELLKYTDAGGWACATDSGGAGGGIATIEENDSSVVASATNIDFLGTDFIVEAVGTEGNISIDYTNSKIVRSDQNETITGSWDFADTLTLADVADTLTLDGASVTFASSDATNDYKIIFDNSSTGDVATLVQVTTSGVGATIAVALDVSDADIATALALGSNDVTVGGATISSTEFALLDSGIALSELTDSGTLTAGTVDINGGAIDGTAIGASSASTGAFTTLTSTGVTTIGNNSATVAINSSDWDISTTGAMTGIGAITSDGAISTTSTFNADGATTLAAVTLDANADLTLSSGTGSFILTNSVSNASDQVIDLAPAFAGGATDTLTYTVIDVAAFSPTNAAGTDTVNGVEIGALTDPGATITSTAVKIGVGWDTVFSIAGTLLSATEVNLLDAGIALSELTDSGTLTAGTVDINGGAIDGTTIGATSASTGAFTTLTSTGVTTIGNNSATVAINSSDWDISTTGAMTGIGAITSDGAISTTSTFNADGATTLAAVTLDANADFTFTSGTGSLVMTNSVSNASDQVIDLAPAFAGGATDTLTYTVIDIAAFAPTNAAGTDIVNAFEVGALTDPGATITSTAIKVGSGWDTVLGGSTAGTSIFDFTNFDVTTAGNLDMSGTITAGSGNEVITLSTGKIDADAITLASSGTTGSTSSRSGLQVSSDGLTLLMGCADGELLEWTDAGGWACATDNTSAGAGIGTVQVGDADVTTATTTLDFLAADFDVTSTEAGAEANIAIDYTNSGITRKAQAETVTGGWTFNTAATTFTTAITANGGIDLGAGSQVVASNLGVAFTESDTNPTCASGDFSIYADASENKLKKCQNGTVLDLAQDSDIVTKAKSADQSVTNSTTLTDETALQFPIAVNEEWNVVWTLQVSNVNSATPDFKAAVVGPTGVTCTATIAGAEPAGAAFPQATTTDCVEAPGALANAAILADANVPFQVWVYANITADGSNAGTVKLQFAENTGGGGTSVVVKAGSIMNAYKVTGADLAEVYYSKDPTIVPGHVVSIDSSIPAGVKKADQTYDQTAIGIVSTKPGLVLSESAAGIGSAPVFVALSGRVPVKVSTQNGHIKPGDLLTSSSIPGVAMRATKAGQIIGQAMTSFEGEGVGSVVAFVKTDNANGTKIANFLPGASTATSADVGKLALDHFIAQKEQLAVSPDLSEVVTDRLAAGFEVITPRLLADQVEANTIRTGLLIADKIHANQIIGLEYFLAQARIDITRDYTDITGQTMGDATPSALLVSTEATVSASPSGILTEFVIIVDSVIQFTRQVVFRAPAEFLGGVFFRSRVTFNNDTAGIVVIPKWSTSVEVPFEQPFETPPIVTISFVAPHATDSAFLSDGTHAAVAEVTTRGFTVMLEHPMPRDATYHWIALAIANPRTVRGTPLFSEEDLKEVAATASPAAVLAVEEEPIGQEVTASGDSVEASSSGAAL